MQLSDLVYKTYGLKEGYPVFYMHGWISSSLEAQLLHNDALTENVFIVAVDRMQSCQGQGMTPDEVTEAIELLVEHFGFSQCGILGCSAGAPYALITGVQCSTINKIAILAGTGIFYGAPLPKTLLKANYQAFVALRYLPWLFHLSLKFIRRSALIKPESFFATDNLPTADREVFNDPEFKNIVAQSFSQGLKLGTRAAYQEGRFMISNWLETINKLSVNSDVKPIHWWHGCEDINVPLKVARKTMGEFNNGLVEFTEVDNMGHASLSQSYYNSALKFLKEH